MEACGLTGVEWEGGFPSPAGRGRKDSGLVYGWVIMIFWSYRIALFRSGLQDSAERKSRQWAELQVTFFFVHMYGHVIRGMGKHGFLGSGEWLIDWGPGRNKTWTSCELAKCKVFKVNRWAKIQ